ncbi:DUF2177 family protein [Actimicrobium sp. CCI2.3]|uniref:DUF2177 family protein n=1 Tax=Actimicrobium sp. CCI2.3 TaxID=3048616 RepID=UPI002AB4DD10|nr:DUF2177 family protein [Actimicrobium sp. CCI2.3]MDY7574376.1 DUF2177 family protein [Actimicrobium sp. CCI2.3]MEB0024129.1 DUF2177 family protein [Actimicrobium sp. CCI2.3]
MTKYLTTYFSTGIVFWILDFVWLGFVIKGFYMRELDGLLLPTPLMTPAIIFYLLYVVGIVVFAVMPALDSNSWTKALMLGALLGLMAYGTYDLSNLATLDGWSPRFAIIDIAWGTSVTAISATLGFWLSRLINTYFSGT